MKIEDLNVGKVYRKPCKTDSTRNDEAKEPFPVSESANFEVSKIGLSDLYPKKGYFRFNSQNSSLNTLKNNVNQHESVSGLMRYKTSLRSLKSVRYSQRY